MHVYSNFLFFSASFLLLSFLFLLIGTPKASWDVNKYIEKEKKRE